MDKRFHLGVKGSVKRVLFEWVCWRAGEWDGLFYNPVLCLDKIPKSIGGQTAWETGRELGDKGTGGGRTRYGKQEVLTPLSLPTFWWYHVCKQIQSHDRWKSLQYHVNTLPKAPMLLKMLNLHSCQLPHTARAYEASLAWWDASPVHAPPPPLLSQHFVRIDRRRYPCLYTTVEGSTTRVRQR